MKRKPISSFLSRLFCLLMALYVFNLSVNPPDQHTYITASGVVKEDLSVNEMESIGEWVLEHIFGIDVAEHNDSDHPHHLIKSFVKWLPPHLITLLFLPVVYFNKTVSGCFVVGSYVSMPANVLSPPPWAV